MRYREAVFQRASFGGKLALAFDFGRAVVVEVHAPVSDVAMMADPVEQLSAAGVVVPAPVGVDALLDVRLHPRRADPHFVIQFRRRVAHGELPGVRARGDFGKIGGSARQRSQFLLQLLLRLAKISIVGRQPDLDARHIANQTVADDFRGFVEGRLRTLPGAGLPDDFMSPGRL